MHPLVAGQVMSGLLARLRDDSTILLREPVDAFVGRLNQCGSSHVVEYTHPTGVEGQRDYALDPG